MREQKDALISSLKKVASDYDAVSQGLFQAANTMEDVPGYNVSGQVYALARIAETNTVQLRNLAARTAHAKKTPYYAELASRMGIEVREEHDWIVVSVPAVLPNRGKKETTQFITHPLRNAIIEFQRANQIERFNECVICIVHSYDEALGLRRVRDYDNVETKRYLDVIEAGFLTNDSGLLCSVLQTTQMSDRDQTDFYLMTPDRFGKWVEKCMKTDT